MHISQRLYTSGTFLQGCRDEVGFEFFGLSYKPPIIHSDSIVTIGVE